MRERKLHYVAIGLALGAGIGVVFHSISIGVGLGLFVGAVASLVARRRQV